MRRHTVVLFVLAAAGCSAGLAPPLARSTTNNTEVQVETLLTHDGCTVYRFWDAGYHYYVKCDGTPPATLNRVWCGKGCTRDEAITTFSAR